MSKNIKPKNEDIQNFLDNIEIIDTKRLEILQTLRKIVLKIFPKTDEEIKYGGIAFLKDDYLFSGIFIRKNHISLEFVQGSKMNDPENLLEGTGKFRRHLKIRCLTDVKDKNAIFFIKQSLS